MARLSRAVFPGLPAPRHPARQWPRPDSSSDEDYALYRDRLGEPAPRRGRGLGLGPDAQSCSPHPGAVAMPTGSGERWRRASPLCRPCPSRFRRTGHFWQGRFGCVGDGRGASRRRASLRRAQSGPGAAAAQAANGPGRASMPISARSMTGSPRAPVRERYPDFEGLLAAAEDAEMSLRLRRAERSGGRSAKGFLEHVEKRPGAALGRQARPAESN